MHTNARVWQLGSVFGRMKQSLYFGVWPFGGLYTETQEKVLCCSVRCAGSTRAREAEDALELTYPLRYGVPRLSAREDKLTWTISVTMQPCRRRAASACVALLVLRQRMAIRGSFCTHRPGLLAGCLIRDPGFQPRRMEWERSSGG